MSNDDIQKIIGDWKRLRKTTHKKEDYRMYRNEQLVH